MDPGFSRSLSLGLPKAGPEGSGRDDCAGWTLPSDLAAHHSADRFPALAVEALHLHLLDRIEVGRAGADLDARQEHADVEIQVRCLAHDVLAGELVAGLLEHLRQ